MVDDDLYGNKARYGKILERIDHITEKPTRAKYYCKNPINTQYFKKLIPYFDAKDLSYIRRNRVLYFLTMITYVIEKDLKDCDREDINKLVAFTHITNKTAYSKGDTVKEIKIIWKILFPERDSLGRMDETIVPYVVRHLSRKVDKSKEKLRNDRVTWPEFEKILGFFSGDKRIQAYLMLALESLGRPQEILYTKIKNYEFHDNFAKIWIAEHGKEGTGFLQCIDSYPYVQEWYQQHPFKHNPNAYFFINGRGRGNYEQLKNSYINKLLSHACKTLQIDKHITCYSLKRNGVTFRRQRGDSDVQIQHAARWTSTKQLKVYDMTTQEDALKIELEKRGMVSTVGKEKFDSKVKCCIFCAHNNGFTAEFCVNCKRPLNREKIDEMAQTHERMINHDMIQRFDRIERIFESMVGKKAGL
ncbi:MAG: tyrosine-type recombinase/integrase [Nanoarchaeota archaeon]|nr:tyrosine-type recombinase/integrase [Nanoarchaeota archaeon]